MTINKLFIFSISCIITLSNNYSIAQEVVFTKEDTIDCNQKILQYKELEKQGKKDEAIVIWKDTYQKYKKLNSRVIIHGINYIKDNLKHKKGSDIEILVDSMMKLYSFYKEYYRNNKILMECQGMDLLKYDKSRINEAYKLLGESTNVRYFDSEPAVLRSYMLSAIKMFSKEKISKSELDSVYLICDTILCIQMKDSINDQDIIRHAKAGIDNIYYSSIHHDYREHLILVLSKRYSKYQDNYEELEKIARILSRFECTDSQLFYDVAAKLDKLKPKALISDWPGRFYSQESKDKYLEEVKSSVIKEKNDSLKAKLYYKIAQLYKAKKEKALAKCYIDSSLQCNNKYGAPYLLLATIYANAFSEDSTATELQKLSGYWAAIDKLLIAKKHDSSIQDAIIKLIERYSAKFPTKDELNKHGLKPGDEYYIGGWINETTTVRVKE